MARIVGGIGCSHAPSIAHSYDRKLQQDPMWAPLYAGWEPAKEWLTQLKPDLMELAIITLAREWRSDIEWTAHAALAAKAGVATEKIEAIRTGKPPKGLTDAEQTVVRFCLELSREKRLSDETFAAAQKLLGTRGAVDLTLTCSYYTAINMAQVALKPEMEPGKQSTL